jgi:hypothetical protein
LYCDKNRGHDQGESYLQNAKEGEKFISACTGVFLSAPGIESMFKKLTSFPKLIKESLRKKS